MKTIMKCLAVVGLLIVINGCTTTQQYSKGKLDDLLAICQGNPDDVLMIGKDGRLFFVPSSSVR